MCPRLDALARLGWVASPSPVQALTGTAGRLKAAWVGVKRDDLLEGLYGGTKVRKLDLLLAAEPFRSGTTWLSAGAIGSGHLATLSAAARALGRRVEAHVFWEPVSQGVVENLAFTASGPVVLHYHRTRTGLALRVPSLLRRARPGERVVVPPGATCPAGVAGVVAAGFELAEQIARGELPVPERVYVALGTGGTAVGLALGLGLAKVRTVVHAVAVVERLLSSHRRLHRILVQTVEWLRAHGVEAEPAAAVPVVIDRSQLGPAYGVPTAQSLAASELFGHGGPSLEPVYTGKVAAALLADCAGGPPASALLWHTARRSPLPHAADWRDRLPPPLSAKLFSCPPRRLGRRAVLAGGVGVAGAGVLARLTGYAPLPGWAGLELSRREALVVAAAAEALLPPGVDPRVVATNVDRFLVSLPPPLLSQLHQLLGLVEHGTALGLQVRRFTALSPDARLAFLETLCGRGGLLAQVGKGIRDLCLMGHYQEPAAWARIGYEGPWTVPPLEEHLSRYDSLMAPAGAVPRTARGTE